MMRLPVTVIATAMAIAVSAVGCRGADVRTTAPAIRGGGDQERGREAIVEQGCSSCHRVPGVSGADAFVGPPLDAWSRRSFIAGTLPNNAANLELWLADPQAVRPGSAMPDLGLDDQTIADLVAYLYSLD